MTNTRRLRLIFTAAMLGYVLPATAGEKGGYPTERVAAFVVNNLDVTSLPSVFRTKKEKGKKTLADYGYTTQKLNEREALVEKGSGKHVLSIRVLEEGASGIYVCVAKPAPDRNDLNAQSVIFLKRKEPSALLKGNESFKEFASCPAIPAIESSGG